MVEASAAAAELQRLKDDISAIDAAMHQKVDEEQTRVARLVDEARNMPTPRQAELEEENQALQEKLTQAEADRDHYKEQIDYLTSDVKETRQKLRDTMKKYNIPLTVVAAIIAVGVLAYFYAPRLFTQEQTQVAETYTTPETPPADFLQGLVVVTQT